MIPFRDGSEVEECEQIWRFGSISCHHNRLLPSIRMAGLGQTGLMLS